MFSQFCSKVKQSISTSFYYCISTILGLLLVSILVMRNLLKYHVSYNPISLSGDFKWNSVWIVFGKQSCSPSLVCCWGTSMPFLIFEYISPSVSLQKCCVLTLPLFPWHICPCPSLAWSSFESPHHLQGKVCLRAEPCSQKAHSNPVSTTWDAT